MTPSPSPRVDVDVDVVDERVLAVVELWAVALSILGAAAVLLVVSVLLVRASRAPFPTAVVAALTILGAVSLAGYVVGGESRAELAAIAGTAVGALAGGVSSLLGRTPAADDERPEVDQ